MHGMAILLLSFLFISFFTSILVHVLIYFAVTDKMLGQYATSRHLVESLSRGIAHGRGEDRHRTPLAQQQEWRMYHSSRHVVPHQHYVGSSHHTHYLGGQVYIFFHLVTSPEHFCFCDGIVLQLAKQSLMLVRWQRSPL